MFAHGRCGSISCPGPAGSPTVSTQKSPRLLSPPAAADAAAGATAASANAVAAPAKRRRIELLRGRVFMSTPSRARSRADMEQPGLCRDGCPHGVVALAREEGPQDLLQMPAPSRNSRSVLVAS